MVLSKCRRDEQFKEIRQVKDATSTLYLILSHHVEPVKCRHRNSFPIPPIPKTDFVGLLLCWGSSTSHSQSCHKIWCRTKQV
jgi:hypothetical protein